MPPRRTNAATIEADETAGPAKKPKPAKAARACACGCGRVGGGEFRAGHDAVWKSRLLTEARAGSTEARSELLRRGWATDARIDAKTSNGRLSDEERAAKSKAKLEAKLARARVLVAELEAQLASGQAVAR